MIEIVGVLAGVGVHSGRWASTASLLRVYQFMSHSHDARKFFILSSHCETEDCGQVVWCGCQMTRNQAIL